MNLIKNLKICKKNIMKVLVGLGIGGTLLVSSRNLGLHLNDGFKPDFYYLNTKNIEMSNEEFLGEFQEKFESSPVLVKEFDTIYSDVSDFVGEYGSYLDQEQLLDTISDLDVQEISDNRFGENLLAYYDFKDNAIYLKDKINYKKDSQVKELKEHEFYHYLFGQGFSTNFSNFLHRGRALDEGMATLLTQETEAFDNTVAYTKNANYVRVICELIGSENFMKACGNHNLNELMDYLSEYSSKSTAKKLIKYIDEACDDYSYNVTEADMEAWNIIEDMYEEKNNCTIENSDDYFMKYYSNKIIKTGYKIGDAKTSSEVNMIKNYFLNVETPKIEFLNDGEVYDQIILEDTKAKVK